MKLDCDKPKYRAAKKISGDYECINADTEENPDACCQTFLNDSGPYCVNSDTSKCQPILNLVNFENYCIADDYTCK